MKTLITILASCLLLLAGCTADQATVEPGTETTVIDQQQDTGAQDGTDAMGADSGADASIIAEEGLTAQEMLEEAGSPLATKVIYFEYDSAKVDDASLGVLEAHGNFIAGNGNIEVRLEGHADERGSREYNIGLGDRRAQSVRRILLFQGASSDQLDTVSYGEEQPVDFGHDEAAWSQNRRVELIYKIN
jgi:peptidoglycan-associated lipoprotein